MPIHSIVLVREVRDTRDLVGTILDADGVVKEDMMTHRFEPEDLNALEMALQIRDTHGGSVTALAIGSPRQVDVLRECLYRGVDTVTRLDDPLFTNPDTTATAQIFSAAVQKIESYDLILSGIDIVEGENSHIGIQVAHLLGIDVNTYVDEIESITDESVVCKRAIEMGYELVESSFPVMLVVGVALLADDPRTPRSAKAKLKLKMKKAPIQTLNAADLGLTEKDLERTTLVSTYAEVPQRTIESKDIDPENESELQSMLNECLQGE